MARLRRSACPSPIRFHGVYISSTLPQIDCTEQFVRFHLDAARNHLLRFDILLSGIATTMSAGAVITGIFGMNLPTHLFDEDDGAPLPPDILPPPSALPPRATYRRHVQRGSDRRRSRLRDADDRPCHTPLRAAPVVEDPRIDAPFHRAESAAGRALARACQRAPERHEQLLSLET